MATQLYPPRLEGTLPAFYKSYEEKINGEQILTGATITIPFEQNKAINLSSVKGIALKLRTVSTSNYIVAGSVTTTMNLDEGWATFNFYYDKNSDNGNDLIAEKFNEGQYYRVQLAYVDNDDVVGYYSTVGIIKCVARPTVNIDDFDRGLVNSLTRNFCVGVYTQDTRFGDSTEKAYSYIFNLWDSDNNLLLTSGEQLHDVTQDTSSYESRDIFNIYTELKIGKVYYLQYTVTTLNKLVLSTNKYKVMRTISIDTEFPIKLHGQPNNEEGYIHLTLKGDTIKRQTFSDDAEEEYDEATGNAAFVITRACDQDNYTEWREIIRFALNGMYPSEYSFDDFTVEQGFKYKYALQQYNIHGIYSNKVPMSYGEDLIDKEGKIYSVAEIDKDGVVHAVDETDADNKLVEKIIAIDFEDMFLYDGQRQLKIRFNPKVASFQETLAEQKIETIGSKYPYIFRNGVVNYKEFPIGGLISYQEDEALLFLNTEEAIHAGMLHLPIEDKYLNNFSVHNDKVIRTGSKYDGTGSALTNLHESRYQTRTTRDARTGKITTTITKDAYRDNKGQLYITGKNSQSQKNSWDGSSVRQAASVRTSKNLDSENILSERYFKLKVLDWLNDGKVKLFRSPTEGMYLVRLLNVKFTPEEVLGRMIHNFTCTAYEIAEVTYDNLVYYGIINPQTPSLYETHWDYADTNTLLKGQPDEDGFYNIPLNSASVTGIEVSDFAPGDEIRITYNSTDPDSVSIYTIGVTGTLSFNNDERPIAGVAIKPNPDTSPYDDFSRSFVYTYTGMRLSEFDVVSNVKVQTQVAEQFVGPKENLLEVYDLRSNTYGIRDEETQLTERTINDAQGVENVYNDLTARNHLSYQLNDTTPKITGYKVDILQVHKREVIPIFARGTVIDDSTIFDVTPFGQPYVPTGLQIEENGDAIHGVHDISNFITENNQINYADGDILSVKPYVFYGGVNIHDIYPLLVANNQRIDHFTILKVYVKNENDEWVEPDTHKYYDTYTESWWEDNEEYDPTFRINEVDPYLGDNNIRLAEIENMVLYNLGEVEQIHLGNGVYAEITIEVRVVDYDIEESSPKVKKAKEDYLKGKANFEAKLEQVHLKANEIQQALIKQANLETQLKMVEDSIDAYDGSNSALDSVIEMVENRIQKQKEHIYDDAISKINKIIELLQSVNLPDRIDDDTIGDDNWKNAALDDADFYKTEPVYEQVEIGDKFHQDYVYYTLSDDETYSVWNAEGSDDEQYAAWEDAIVDPGLYINVTHPQNEYSTKIYDVDRSEFLNKDRDYDDRDVELYKTETLASASDFNFTYVEQERAKLADNEEKKADAEDQILELEKLIGQANGLYSDVINTDGSYDPDTIAYYDDQIANQEALIETLTNKYNEELEKLNNAILEAKQAILYATLAGENDDLLDQYTDQYILDNVNALRERLAILIDAVNNDLDTLDNRFVADLKDVLPEYEYIKIDPTSEYNEDYIYYQLNGDGQYVEYVYNADNWNGDRNNLYTKAFVDYGYKYSSVTSGTIYDENTTYYTRTTDDKGKETYNKYEYGNPDWATAIENGLYVKVPIENDNKDLNQNKVQAVKDYLTEYNAITKDHANDIDWLKDHFAETMDRFMVQVKKE